MNIEIELHNSPAHLQKAVSNFMYEYYLVKRETEELYKDMGKDYDYSIFMILKFTRMMEMAEYAKEKYNMNFKVHWGYRVETSYGVSGLEPNVQSEIEKYYHVEKPDYAKVENIIKAFLPELKKTVIPEMISIVVGFDDIDNRIDVENKICLLWKDREQHED
jgi:hypothetical protein